MRDRQRKRKRETEIDRQRERKREWKIKRERQRERKRDWQRQRNPLRERADIKNHGQGRDAQLVFYNFWQSVCSCGQRVGKIILMLF
jgi:hypothetical protein